MTDFSFENRVLGITGNPELHRGVIEHALGAGAIAEHAYIAGDPSSRMWDDVDRMGSWMRQEGIDTVVAALGDRVATLAVEMANLAGRPTNLLLQINEDHPTDGQPALQIGDQHYTVTPAETVLERSLNSSNFAILLGKI